MCASPNLLSRACGLFIPQLQCRIEFHTWVASEFHWKEVSSSLGKLIPARGGDDIPTEESDPQVLGEVDLDITLTTTVCRRYRHLPPEKMRTNEHYLSDEAFRPREFKVRLERGCFSRLWGFSDAKSEFRIVFEPSPFPPCEMWKRPDRGPKAYKFWEWKTFVEGDASEIT